jgi:hypothetical protein
VTHSGCLLALGSSGKVEPGEKFEWEWRKWRVMVAFKVEKLLVAATKYRINNFFFLEIYSKDRLHKPIALRERCAKWKSECSESWSRLLQTLNSYRKSTNAENASVYGEVPQCIRPGQEIGVKAIGWVRWTVIDFTHTTIGQF